jgi:hypothetical protein
VSASRRRVFTLSRPRSPLFRRRLRRLTSPPSSRVGRRRAAHARAPSTPRHLRRPKPRATAAIPAGKRQPHATSATSPDASSPSPPPSLQVAATLRAGAEHRNFSSVVAGARAAGVAAGPQCSTATTRVATEIASSVSVASTRCRAVVPVRAPGLCARATSHAGP